MRVKYNQPYLHFDQICHNQYYKLMHDIDGWWFEKIKNVLVKCLVSFQKLFFVKKECLCGLFTCEKMLYRRLVYDVVEIFVLQLTSFFRCSLHAGCSYPCARQIARVFIVTIVNICKVIFDWG